MGGYLAKGVDRPTSSKVRIAVLSSVLRQSFPRVDSNRRRRSQARGRRVQEGDETILRLGPQPLAGRVERGRIGFCFPEFAIESDPYRRGKQSFDDLGGVDEASCEIGDQILQVWPNEMERHFRFRESERLDIVHREPRGNYSWAFAKM